MKRPRAVVFDLDGTLVETREDIAAASNHALARVGAPRRGVDEVAALVGDGSRALVARLLGIAPSDPSCDAALGHYLEYYGAHPADHARTMPGLAEAIDALAGVPLAVATNKPRPIAVALLEALGLRGHFQVVVAGGDGPLKPDPAAIHAALRPLGVAAADAWMVGDGLQDLLAGRAAGAATVAVLGGFGSEASLRGAEADRVIRSLHELPALVRAFTAAVQTGR